MSMKTFPCRVCQKPIAMITLKMTGKKTPVDPNSVLIESENEKNIIITDQGEKIKNPALGTIGYIPHYMICTAKKFPVRKGHRL